MGWKPKKGLAHREIDGAVYIVDAAGSRLHRLNGTASFIWKSLASGKAPGDTAASLREEFEVGEEEASADTVDFIRELEKAGLLEKD
ncbi:MAG: PqqD family protein [Elusimicrobiota bacterium]|jgi:hypothetical protein